MGFLYSQFFVRPAWPTRSFAGETVIVTGANTGLGKEAARHIARLGAARLILAVRNTKAGEAARADIERTEGPAAAAGRLVEVWPLDLASYASVRAFAARAERELDRLDVLLENAAVIGTDPADRPEGHERTLTVNVVSTVLLAALLLPKLRATAAKTAGAAPPRLVIVTSEVHRWPRRLDGAAEGGVFAALDADEKMGLRYPQSKLLEVLAVREMAPLLDRSRSGVVLTMLNPGLCHSELARNSGCGLAITKFFLARTTEVGSRTLVAGAAAGREAHGKYMSDGVVHEDEVSAFVRSEEGGRAQREFWKELCGMLEEIEPGVTKNF